MIRLACISMSMNTSTKRATEAHVIAPKPPVVAVLLFAPTLRSAAKAGKVA
jgi:hypothetical protein